jgi:HD-GYP domain-containing protein (c-di-GMP phosphodiesterase class II)
MRIARTIRLGEIDQADLFYALLLKDAGCASNAARVHQLFGGDDHAAKRAVWLRDWRQVAEKVGYGLEFAGRGERWPRRALRVARLAVTGAAAERELFRIRCDRGAAIALDLGLSSATAEAIRTMDEHWDGGGHPAGLRGADIPLLGRIVGLAQVIEIFAHEQGPERAIEIARARSGRWFDPQLVDAAAALAADSSFWQQLAAEAPGELVSRAEPSRAAVIADEERLDRIAQAFAAVIDAKSPYTSDHSRRVATLATNIGARLGFAPPAITRLRRAALLHDIGKLGVPNSILDKPGRLTPDEWAIVRRHPAHTFEILDAVPLFRDFALDASCHHEKLDGSGYHAGRSGDDLSPAARILAVADICDALLADRPYRGGLRSPEVARIVRRECGQGALCPEAVAAAVDVLEALH